MVTVAFLEIKGISMSMNTICLLGAKTLQNNTLYIKKKCCVYKSSKASKNLKAEAIPKLHLVIWLTLA